MNNIYEKLMEIQQELKAPKGQYNSFGKYKYRNCEDILESVKPILKKLKLVLTLQDNLEQIGNRYYVKATATLTDIITGNNITNTAYAREEDEKKGMDGSQITGASSSYARKYALNGLFAIDDTKDSDTTNDEVPMEVTKEDAEKYEVTFGKHKGKSLKQLMEEDKGYLDWLLNNTKDEYVRKCIETLTGKTKATDEENDDRAWTLASIQKLEIEQNIDHAKALEHYNVTSDAEMTIEQLKDYEKRLKERTKAKAKTKTKETTQKQKNNRGE